MIGMAGGCAARFLNHSQSKKAAATKANAANPHQIQANGSGISTGGAMSRMSFATEVAGVIAGALALVTNGITNLSTSVSPAFRKTSSTPSHRVGPCAIGWNQFRLIGTGAPFRAAL